MEVRKRKTQRQSAAWLLTLVLIGVVGLAVVVFLAGKGISQRMAAAKELDRAIAIARQADATVLRVDGLVRVEPSAANAKRISEAQDAIPAARSSLTQAVKISESAYPGLNDDEREQAVAHKEASLARIALLDAARPLLDSNTKLSEAVGPATDAYAALARSEKNSDAAVRSYNTLTKAGVQKSLDLNEQARKDVVAARKGFTEAQKAFPGSDFGAFTEYADARIDLLDVSIASDKAFLAGNPAKANSLADEFNAAEKRMTDAAKKLPKSGTAPLERAYDAQTASLQKAFFAARDRVTAADKTLREQ